MDTDSSKIIMGGKSSRYEFIDIAKVICIFLMVWGHGNLAGENITRWIYSFHMPLFFVLSGFLYKPRHFKEQTKKDFNSLMVPYYLINLICLIPSVAIMIYKNYDISYLAYRIGAIFLGLGYKAGNFQPVCSPMWFIVCLFIMRCTISIIYRNISNLSISVITILSVFITLLLDKFSIDILVPIDTMVACLPFFFLGFVLKRYWDEITRKFCNWTYFLVSILGLISCFILSNINGLVDVDYMSFGKNLGLFYITAISGSIFVLSFSKVIEGSSSVIRVISDGTLLIVGFNLWLIILIKHSIKFIVPGLSITPIIGFAITLTIIILFYFLILLVKKYFPIIIGKR